MRVAPVVAIVVAGFVATGCQTVSKQDSGTVIGAVAGGIIGSQVGKGSGRVAAAAIGAFVGGVVGHQIGRSLDEADRRAAMEAEYRALEYGHSGKPTRWKNPDSGHAGTVVPGKPYVSNRLNCREFTHTIYIDGRPQTMRGKACRQPDGTWRNVG